MNGSARSCSGADRNLRVSKTTRTAMSAAATKIESKKAATNEVCDHCFTPAGSGDASKLSVCARCGLVRYCSKNCQKAHWKANHKHHCVAKTDRAPQKKKALSSQKESSSAPKAGHSVGECSICLDSMKVSSTTTLACSHTFHAACVAELRKFGVKQACPLCRSSLLPGPEKAFEEAIQHYVVFAQLVLRGEASWSNLPAAAQLEMDTAVHSLKRLAEEGFAEAQEALGLFHEKGYGVKQSSEEAVRYLVMGANQGDAEAQFNLGVMISTGCGVAQSDEESARWFKKAAEQGHPSAQMNLGQLFKLGHGVAQSFDEAARWTKLAAE